MPCTEAHLDRLKPPFIMVHRLGHHGPVVLDGGAAAIAAENTIRFIRQLTGTILGGRSRRSRIAIQREKD